MAYRALAVSDAGRAANWTASIIRNMRAIASPSERDAYMKD